MAVIALVGTPGSPGVTSSALALLRTWPLEDNWRVLLAECDPDGGAVLPGALQSRLPADRGLRHLAVSSRLQGQDLVQAFWTQLIALNFEGDAQGARRRLLLPGLTDLAQASRLGAVWPQLADLFAGIEAHQHDVLVDLGRSGAFGAPGVLALEADTVLVVVRGTLRGVHAASSRVAALRRRMEGEDGRGSSGLGVLLITEGAYSAREVEEALGVPVVLTLPYAPKDASVLSDGGSEDRRFARCELLRAARTGAAAMRGQGAARRPRITSPLHQKLREVAAGGR
ncbi:hypothetical protein GCM10010329_83020 [Streptomyces spiroverticillatus]|uniref:Uncharacterized protein n=1 Tax=Streptomyces finlayi TaxID=67296 RepID=A0A919CFN5_9ACTN|nr:hypothetical protein [Streptomyces finlayi]GHA47990.1 hypothetical protein GCM10010329_83020 [Streptomyces spiroverticillatus]GHD18858.1 hypothetical protein GCM10010334_82080 [Streptomyces finlayi]